MASEAAHKASEAAIKAGAAETVAKALGDKAFAGVMADEAAKKLAGEVGKRATAIAAEKFGGLVGMAANSGTMEAGQIYPDAVEEAKKTGQPVDLGRVGLASLLAASLDVLPEARIGAKILDGAGKNAGKSLWRRAATEIPKQMAFEGVTEGAQTPIEHWGAKKDPMAPENVKDTINSAAMGAVGGMFGGALAAIPGGPKNPPKKVPEWIPGSPLTNAANVAVAQVQPPGTPTSQAPAASNQPGSANANWAGYDVAPTVYGRPDLDAKLAGMAQYLSADYANEQKLVDQLKAAGSSVSTPEQLRALWAQATEPGVTVNPQIAENMLAMLNIPNFTRPEPSGALVPSGGARTAVGPARRAPDGSTIDGEATTIAGTLPGAQRLLTGPNQAPQLPTPGPGPGFVGTPGGGVRPAYQDEGGRGAATAQDVAGIAAARKAAVGLTPDVEAARARDHRFSGIRAKLAEGWQAGTGLTITNPATGATQAISPAEKAHLQKLQKDAANGPATAPAATNAGVAAARSPVQGDVVPGSPAVAGRDGNVPAASGPDTATGGVAPGSEAALAPGAVGPTAVTGKQPWQMTKAEAGDSLNAKGWKSSRGVQVVAPSPKSGLYETTHDSKTDVYLPQAEAEQYIRDYNTTAHRRHVEYALAQGKPVPAEVLADYPDLKQPASTNQTPATAGVSTSAAPLSDADLESIFNEAAGEVAGQGAQEPQPGVTLDDVPPKLMKKIKVPVERMVGSDIKTVEVSANEAIADLDEEISAYEKLLACVRSA
jgi:hypothetical protein